MPEGREPARMYAYPVARRSVGCMLSRVASRTPVSVGVNPPFFFLSESDFFAGPPVFARPISTRGPCCGLFAIYNLTRLDSQCSAMQNGASDLSTSSLTKALHRVKPEMEALIAQRNYLAVRDLRQRCRDEVEASKVVQQRQVAQQHELERERLAQAHTVMTKKALVAANELVHGIRERFDTQLSLHAARQQRHIEQFAHQTFAKEAQRPMVYSGHVRDLLQAEAHLVKLGLYEEADFAKRKIGSAAAAERARFRAQQRASASSRVAKRQEVLDDAAECMRTRRRNEISMALHRAGETQQLVDKQFRHSAEEMAHAHRLELRRNPLLQTLQCLPAMRRRRELASSGHSDENSCSASVAAKVSRGTDLLRRAVGSRYEVPSLCDSYGTLVEFDAVLPRCSKRRADVDVAADDVSAALVASALPPPRFGVAHHARA